MSFDEKTIYTWTTTYNNKIVSTSAEYAVFLVLFLVQSVHLLFWWYEDNFLSSIYDFAPNDIEHSIQIFGQLFFTVLFNEVRWLITEVRNQ